MSPKGRIARYRPGADPTARPVADDGSASGDAELLAKGGREVRLTHPERVIWPMTGTTKRDLVEYLLAVAPVLLAALRGRATMLWRFPEGIDGPGWFQPQCRSRPEWVPTHEVVGKRGDILHYCVIEEPATLAWLANLGTIELHPHGWRVDRPDEPSAVVFDLDPGPPAGVVEAASVALRIRERLIDRGLEPVVKTSGGLGLHVVAPLASGHAWDAVKAFARQTAEALAAEAPGRVIARSERTARAGRVYVDWIQNDRNRQLVAPYSPRALAIPQVSTPLAWDEVAAGARGDVRAFRPSFGEVLDRVERLDDLWAGGEPGTLG
jgi:bifunctional non-homologous end joining protein LigD